MPFCWPEGAGCARRNLLPPSFPPRRRRRRSRRGAMPGSASSSTGRLRWPTKGATRGRSLNRISGASGSCAAPASRSGNTKPRSVPGTRRVSTPTNGRIFLTVPARSMSFSWPSTTTASPCSIPAPPTTTSWTDRASRTIRTANCRPRFPATASAAASTIPTERTGATCRGARRERRGRQRMPTSTRSSCLSWRSFVRTPSPSWSGSTWARRSPTRASAWALSARTIPTPSSLRASAAAWATFPPERIARCLSSSGRIHGKPA